MTFFEDQIYHIFNQGNNRNNIFFFDENYDYFLWKMKSYLLPFGDFISWCLMPNHFHWQFYVRKKYVDVKTAKLHLEKVENERRRFKYGSKAKPYKALIDEPRDMFRYRSLNVAIGLVQRVYAQSFNNINARSGSIFRQKCKAKNTFDIRDFFGFSASELKKFNLNESRDYTTVCFYYIHENPVKAGLVSLSTEWQYSSAKEYAGFEKNPLCNIKLGRELVMED